MKTKNNISIEQIGKELPFSVPENYFEQFAQSIDKQIGANKPSHSIIRPWMYVAAMFVGIIITGQIFYSTNQQKLAKNTENYESYVLSQVDETSVVDYYVENSK